MHRLLKKFNRKHDYVRHLMDCRKVGKQYECEKCNYVSYRKDNVDRHNHEQRLNPCSVNYSNLSEKKIGKTVICNALKNRLLIIGGGKILKVFSTEEQYCASIKCYGTKEFDFDIGAIESFDNNLIIIGEKDCMFES